MKCLKSVIKDGTALELFGALIEAQGGNPAIIHDTALLPTAKYKIEVQATESGYITSMGANDIGVAAMLLGAGRADKDDEIDLSVGIILKKKIGDSVQKGEVTRRHLFEY